MNDLVIATIRTVVPSIVGTFVLLLGGWGVELDQAAQAGLGGANYQGDPRFREKARNYDRDVAEATGGYVETKVFIKK